MEGVSEATGYRCGECGNGKSFKALKDYAHKVEVDAEGTVLEAHGIRQDVSNLYEVECAKCGAPVEEEV